MNLACPSVGEPLGCVPEQRRLAHWISRRELQQAPTLMIGRHRSRGPEADASPLRKRVARKMVSRTHSRRFKGCPTARQRCEIPNTEWRLHHLAKRAASAYVTGR
jgi:hypothetical protein